MPTLTLPFVPSTEEAGYGYGYDEFEGQYED
jgi:hypothetical protein